MNIKKTSSLIIVLFAFWSFTSVAQNAKNDHSISIFPQDSVDYLAKAFKKRHSKNEIISIPKGQRPLPSNYLKSRYIRRHLRSFRAGASFLVPKNILDRFGRTILGREDGQFVMSKKEMDDLLAKANGQLSYIETELGIPAGYWKNTELIRIDIQKPKRLHIRIPSGNEAGANDLWIPGGKLPNGFSESVVNPIPKGKYTETLIILK
jgi:hypothetical protein